MAQEYTNFFALLGDEEGLDVSELIDRVNQEEKKKKKQSAMVEKVQNEKKKDQKKMVHQIPSDMRAKPLILPYHVRRSFVVFDKRKEREKAEAEARRDAEEDAKAKGLVENNGESSAIVAADDNAREQPVNGGQSNALSSYQDGHHRGQNGPSRRNRGNYNNQRNSGGANVYHQQSNGFNGGSNGRANRYPPKNGGQYKGRYRGDNGNQQYNRDNGVPNGEDPSVNVADDGWRYVGRKHPSNRQGTYQEPIIHEQDGGIKHDNLKESKNSENDSTKSVNGDNDHYKVEGQLPVTTEGEEDAQSENKSAKEEDGAKSEKKSKKKNKNKEIRTISEKKDNNQKDVKYRNLMTLAEYEKKVEDSKSLDAYKRPEQRKIEGKDFQSMQLIGKKKEDTQDSQPKFEYKFNNKKANIKEEKVEKALSIAVCFKQAEGQKPYYMWPNLNDDRYTDVKGNEERHNGKHEGKRLSDRVDGENPTNPKGYGEKERPSGRRYGGKPNDKNDEKRFGGRRPNYKRDGDSDGPSTLLAQNPSPSFEFEQHHFPALR